MFTLLTFPHFPEFANMANWKNINVICRPITEKRRVRLKGENKPEKRTEGGLGWTDWHCYSCNSKSDVSVLVGVSFPWPWISRTVHWGSSFSHGQPHHCGFRTVYFEVPICSVRLSAHVCVCVWGAYGDGTCSDLRWTKKRDLFRKLGKSLPSLKLRYKFVIAKKAGPG